MRRLIELSAAAAALVAIAGVRAARAQHDHHQPAAPVRAGADSVHERSSAEGAMNGAIAAGAHIKLTPMRTASAADSARAAAIVVELRRSIAKYKDVRVAEEDGFAMFAPKLKTQRVFHFTSNRQAIKEHFRFDPAQPTSLLYKKDARGRFVLTGAMYVAPKGATPEELDARIPLSVAQWHAHVNVCVPKARDRERWRETQNGRMRFGPAGAIATKEQCDDAGGRFHPQIFGWMVHANIFESDDPKVIWGHEHAAGGH